MLLVTVLLLRVPLPSSSESTGGGNCSAFYSSLVPARVDAQRWCEEGSYFTFASPANAGAEVQLFGRCSQASTSKLTIVLGHGWPTSSFDFQALAALLEPSLRVCSLDYVGAGFSDKPPAPFRYHIADHAAAIYHFVTVVHGLQRFAYLTHDEGSSVGLAFLQLLEQKAAAGTPAPFEIVHHFVLDGSIYLPAANITPAQVALLSNTTGPAMQKAIEPSELALGLGHTCYTPPLTLAQTEELSSVFAYRNGTHILHETIQYLQDRHRHEVEWLQVLGRSAINCSLVWGTEDPIATLAVADYVWENYLRNRTSAPATFTKIQGANHYLTVDHAAEVARLVLSSLGF